MTFQLMPSVLRFALKTVILPVQKRKKNLKTAIKSQLNDKTTSTYAVEKQNGHFYGVITLNLF